MFCPECGAALTETGTGNAGGANAKPAREKVGAGDSGQSATQVAAAAPLEASGKSAPDERPRVRERTRDTLHRASSVARGAIEDNVKRVEKIHHVSTVMLEEATYDPSLRFVLVAVGLFLVFVILLILTKVMG